MHFPRSLQGRALKALLFNDDDLSSSTFFSSALENWRQYVSLGVIGLVILDIVLGSPFVNMLMAPIRRASDAKYSEEGEEGDRNVPSLLNRRKKNPITSDSRERIDTEAIAKAALEKALGASELRDYLERNKTEKDRVEDLKREVDRKLADFE